MRFALLFSLSMILFLQLLMKQATGSLLKELNENNIIKLPFIYIPASI